MPSNTARLGLPYPLVSDSDNVPTDMQNLANRIDEIVGAESSGTLAARPAAGNAGFKYWATDAVGADGTTGVLYWDNGSAWVAVNPEMTVFGRTGNVAAEAGDYTAAEVTNAADKASATTQMFTANVQAPAFVATLAGALGRYVGVTNGAPSGSGYVAGDFANDPTNQCFWLLTNAGWKAIGMAEHVYVAQTIAPTGPATVPTNTITPIPMATTVIDTDGGKTMNSVYTVQQGGAGRWMVNGGVGWSANSNGDHRACAVQVNGVTVGAQTQDGANPGAAIFQTCFATPYLAVGDTVSIVGIQDSGGGLILGSGSLGGPYAYISMHRIGLS